jgi:amino-acid N-acetyltransferase
VKVRGLGPGDRVAIRDLLDGSGLPTTDLDQATIRFLGYRDEAGLAGVVGVELFGGVGLLRSLAVRSDLRGSGLGVALVEAAERLAVQQGALELFLLTTTAEPFFGRRGYARRDRASAPASIRETTEFTSICPSSAAFMSKAVASPPHRL